MALPVTFLENFRMAFATLRNNKLRSFLTIIGVMIGVIVVMLISSLISGISVAFEKQIESFGTNSIIVTKLDLVRFGRPTQEERMRKPLTADDAAALSELSTVETAVPMLDVSSGFWGGRVNVSSKNGKTSASVGLQGTLPDFEKTGSEVLTEGRWFSQAENDFNKDVCLIGSAVADAYFPYGNPIGEDLEIGGRNFTVIGLLQKREQFLGGDGSSSESNVIYMPLGSALRLKPQADDMTITVVAKDGMLDRAKDQVQDLMRVRRKVPFGEKDNFSMSTAASIIDTFSAITSGVFMAMIVISSVGLMIGGIGVMNIMLVSVTERTREIGIRKALGAKRNDILLQFLVEAATLTGFGGLVGLMIGWGLSFLISLVFPSYVPLWAPIAGFVASVGIGLIFGLFPAWKAARLDPIEALRYE